MCAKAATQIRAAAAGKRRPKSSPGIPREIDLAQDPQTQLNFIFIGFPGFELQKK
jgi:hypothetical protein